jgi:hypothetical protein
MRFVGKDLLVSWKPTGMLNCMKKLLMLGYRHYQLLQDQGSTMLSLLNKDLLPYKNRQLIEITLAQFQRLQTYVGIEESPGIGSTNAELVKQYTYCRKLRKKLLKTLPRKRICLNCSTTQPQVPLIKRHQQSSVVKSQSMLQKELQVLPPYA